MSEAKWYILHTYSGYENKVANDIRTLAENRNLQQLIEDVMVPIGPATDDYGKPVLDKEGNQKEEKLFPCYVYVKMVMTDETWYICRNTRGVTGFVGPGSKPIPLTDEEVRNLGVVKQTVQVRLAEGDLVNIISGSLEGFEGTVREVDEAAGTVVVTVSMFGRETPTTLELSAVEKIN
ncbi:MAG: transcription termination/antitermination protein NusG [Bacteroides sp.]|nr:transcription termination/antitermination protein NusG [Eubacterium sp.]MCM1418734.1 transcription termination/antitermination protein NusG [Roseburia sp.]MCM1462801.1 transcription termination/antitermination protein NusG [Bacteroides sp.]